MTDSTRNKIGHALIRIGWIVLPIYIVCAFILRPEWLDKESRGIGVWTILLVIILGSTLQKTPDAAVGERQSGRLGIRKPFRILAGLIAVLGMIGVCGGIWAYVRTGDIFILSALLAVVPTAFIFGFISLKDRFPFLK